MTDLEQQQIDNDKSNIEASKKASDQSFKQNAKMKALDKAQPKASVTLFLKEAEEIYKWIIKEDDTTAA